jgi:hypothetical protein
MYLNYHPFFILFNDSVSRDVEMLSLFCSRSSGVVPSFGVSAIPDRTGAADSTPLPRGMMLFTVLTMKSGCARGVFGQPHKHSACPGRLPFGW